MDPLFLEMIQQLLSSQGGAFGLPTGGAGSTGPLGQVFGQVKGFMDDEKASEARQRLNLDPLRDIAPYRVNPYRGFLAQKGGGVDGSDAGEVMPMGFVPPSEGSLPGNSTIMDNVRNQIAMQAFQQMKMGGVIGDSSIYPPGSQMDTINNTPSNVFGGGAGKYSLTNADMYNSNPFSIPKNQPFIDPIFGNRLHSQQPLNFRIGGSVYVDDVEHAFLGKLIKRAGKGLKKIGEGIWQGVKGSADWGMGILGMPDVINNTFVDRSKFLSGANQVVGTLGRTAADMFVPGLGSGIGLIGGQINQMAQGNHQPGAGGVGGMGYMGMSPNMMGSGIIPVQGSMFNRINQGGVQAPIVQRPQAALPTTGMFTGQFSSPGPFGGPFAMPNMGGGTMSVPGFAGGFFDIPTGTPRFQEGGAVRESVSLIPIQTEKVGKQPEMIIHIDGSITPVNAKKRHSQMDDDLVTDIVPEGSYIASADGGMRISRKRAEDIVMGVKALPYKEMKKGKLPEQYTLAELWGKKTGKMTPAQLADKLAKKMEVMDMDHLEHGPDPFTKHTNIENLRNRIPYIAQIVKLNEEKKDGPDVFSQLPSFGGGGSVMMPGVRKAPLGDFLGKALEFLPSALPFIGSLFGSSQRNRQGAVGIDPRVASGMLATIPQYQYGVMQNIGAQSGALNQGIEDFSSLGNQLIQNARDSAGIQLGANQAGINYALQGQGALGQAALGSAGLGVMGAFASPIEQEMLDLGASRARVNNYRPRSASRAAMEAAATPQFDQQALAALGPRAATVLAQAESDRMRSANQMSTQRNQFLDQTEQNRIAQLNQIDQQESLFNIGQGQREQDLLRQRNAQAFGSMQQGVQDAGQIQANMFGIRGAGAQRSADIQSGLLGQMGNIQSQILPITTQFALQNAQLAGQPNMLGAQNALNAYNMLAGIQSQNAMAALLPQNLGGQAPGFGTGPTDSFGNMLRYLGSQMRGGQGMDPLPSLPGITPPISVNSTSGGPYLGGRPPGVGIAPLPTLPNRRIPITPPGVLPGLGGGVTPMTTPSLPGVPGSLPPLIPSGQLSPVYSQTQGNPFCAGGVHMITGQPC